MNDIEFDKQNRETRAQRSQRMRRLLRMRHGMLTLTGLTALSLTMLVGSNLIQPTYSIFTSKAGLSGGFIAKESFCGKDGEDDGRRDHDLTVSDALYKDLGTSQDKGGGRDDDKGHCKGGKEHDDSGKDREDDKHLIPDTTLPARSEDAAKPIDPPNPPAPGTDQPSQGNGQPSQGDGKPGQDNGKPVQDNGKQDQRNDQTAQPQQKEEIRIPPQRMDHPMDESRPESEYGVYRGPMSSPSDVPPR